MRWAALAIIIRRLAFGTGDSAIIRFGALTSGPILSTTYLSSAETRGYVVVTSDTDLRGDATLNASLDHLEPCRK